MQLIRTKHISFNKFRIHITSDVASSNIRNSVYVEERATIGCFLVDQETLCKVTCVTLHTLVR